MKPIPSESHPPSDPPGSLQATYFDSLYNQTLDGDPWQFARSPYEAAKYGATLARLPRPYYRSALEVGCSIGVFTRMLADRVADLLAVDLAESALIQARHRCRNHPQVRFEQRNLLETIPTGPFDLIVLAEVAYYWIPSDLDRVLRSLIGQLDPSGQMILVHWKDAVPDYPQTGDSTHLQTDLLARELGLTHVGRWVDVEYRTDLWERPEADFIGDSAF